MGLNWENQWLGLQPSKCNDYAKCCGDKKGKHCWSPVESRRARPPPVAGDTCLSRAHAFLVPLIFCLTCPQYRHGAHATWFRGHAPTLLVLVSSPFSSALGGFPCGVAVVYDVALLPVCMVRVWNGHACGVVRRVTASQGRWGRADKWVEWCG
jgi:hypothetical protein